MPLTFLNFPFRLLLPDFQLMLAHPTIFLFNFWQDIVLHICLRSVSMYLLLNDTARSPSDTILTIHYICGESTP